MGCYALLQGMFPTRGPNCVLPFSCIAGGFFTAGPPGMEKAMSAHSGTLPGNSRGRRSLVGCSPCGHYQSDTAERLHFHFPFMHWRRQWQPTPVFLPGEAQGSHRVGSHRVGHDGSDLAEQSHQGSTVAPSVTAVLVFSMCYSFVGFHML